jgi:hypothetical protein
MATFDAAERLKFWVVWSPQGRTPTVQHWNRASADTEAKRLAQTHPGQDFFVLKASRGFRGVEPPEPTTLKMIPDDGQMLPF